MDNPNPLTALHLSQRRPRDKRRAPVLTFSDPSRRAGSVAILAVSFLAACGTAGASASPTASQTPATSSTPQPTPTPSATSTVPPGWTSYTSATQKVAFGLPPTWKVYCDDGVSAPWLLVVSGGLYTGCPQGDGQVGIFVESVIGTGPPTGLSLISTSRSLYSDVHITTVQVNGVSGTRLSGDQTEGQGSGSSQLEYDVEASGRSYYVLAIVGGIAGTKTATAAQVDQFVQTLAFGA